VNQKLSLDKMQDQNCSSIA